MNRQERRAAGKGQNDQRINVTGIVVYFEGGQSVNLDTNKVQLVDKQTGRPVFEEVLEANPQQIENSDTQHVKNSEEYTVQFDTPEGKMEYVKSGNWSGVRKAK